MPSSNPTPLALNLKAQIHPTLNDSLDIEKLAAKSGKRIWWVCQTYGHPYQSTPAQKTDGQACSVCSGKQVHEGFNDLATVRSDIAHQWHPTLNGSLTPKMVVKSYSKKVWWKCDLGHEFQSLANNRKDSSHCPVCSGKTVVPGFNDAATLLPQLVDKFHPTKNGDITMNSIGKSYAKKLWWIADCGHEIEALISNCSKKVPCPYCIGHKIIVGFNDLATTHPELVKEWHPTKNGTVTPEAVTIGGKNKIWWICEEGHEDFALAGNRLNKKGVCSYCAGNKLLIGTNDFETLYPEVSKEWHPTLNGEIKPGMIAPNANKKYWWLCSTCHEPWEALPSNRGSKGTGCPVCKGKTVKQGINDLATVMPSVAAQWHPTKNGELSPTQITAGTPQNLWWKCANGHEWQMRMTDMAKSFVAGHSGCGICYRMKLPTGAKSLAEMHPEISKEWDYSKNDTTPDVVAQFSSKSAWWICSINPDHSWVAPISSRTYRGSNCSICWKEGSGSQAEEDIALYLESLGVAVERKVITLLENRRELDIYLPEFKVAIEYNGLHWHSEKYRDRKYHISKYEECLLKGITLIQIWEDDWLDRKEIILRHLAYKLNKMNELKQLGIGMDAKWFDKHHARKLMPTNISFATASSFLDAAHIQGASKSSYYFGLEDKEQKLVAVMAMTKTDTAGEYLLSRYATQGIVIGGFTKLLKYAISVIDPKKVITFSDNAVSNGALYANNGFANDGLVREDYMYVKNKKRLHKFGFRLSKFKANPNMVYFEGLTEKELATLNGFIRIWDAGKIRWIWSKP